MKKIIPFVIIVIVLLGIYGMYSIYIRQTQPAITPTTQQKEIPNRLDIGTPQVKPKEQFSGVNTITLDSVQLDREGFVAIYEEKNGKQGSMIGITLS